MKSSKVGCLYQFLIAYTYNKDKKEGDNMFTAIVFGIILTGTIGFIISAEVVW